MFPSGKNKSSFTLIELLVVLALVAILSVVVILTLNPAELIKQARDSNRLSDLSTINTALNLFSTDVTSGFMGTSTVVYVSIPSASPTCSGAGLPTLPSAYTYNCVTTANLRNTDGTGWIPVNFQRISSNSPISQLPVDPINTTSTRLYYSYVAGGSWELNATIEASKNKLGGSGDLVSKDGGSATSQYEIGNNLNLNPVEAGDSSLVGYWNFEEGPNATSSDRSGYGNHGTWYGTSTAEQRYVAGKVGSYAGYFNGGSDYILTPAKLLPTNLINNGHFFSAWVKFNNLGANKNIFMSQNIGYLSAHLTNITASARIDSTQRTTTGIIVPTTGVWYFVSGGYDGSSVVVYFNGVYDNRNAISGTDNPESNITFKIGSLTGASYFLDGFIDDVRIYNRFLSAAEILALYNATK